LQPVIQCRQRIARLAADADIRQQATLMQALQSAQGHPQMVGGLGRSQEVSHDDNPPHVRSSRITHHPHHPRSAEMPRKSGE
jgi:hypothetical protein